jgi:predicted phage baseplate assembly protein
MSRRYIVRADDDTISTIAFGDGKSGARLPTGQENIIAVYRSGIGPDGEVDAESLTVLQSRPKGIKDVTNPISALGAAAPEELWSARRNAPMTVLTLGRIVSLSDFENFARSFAGIGKAQAVSLSWKGVRLLHITVASSSGRVIDQGSELMKNLVRAIDAMRDPVSRIRERVIVESFIPRTFSLKARIQVDDHYLAADVLSQIEIELKRNFSFENREFGQFVTAAEVLSVMQSADGVVAIDLEQLYRDDEQTKTARSTDSNSAVDKNNASIILQASRASIDINGTTVSAELLLLNPSDISLEENIL